MPGPLQIMSVLLLLAACDLPRDMEGTLKRVEGGVMRVGVIENPPWVSVSGGDPTGVEPRLVAVFARELGARVEWIPGPESSLLEALDHRMLDLVIGGITESTPWKRRVALTDPYYTDSLAVGLPPASPPIGALQGHEIAVELGDPAAAYVRDQGATPVFVRDLAEATGPVAAPEWRLASLGRASAGVTLHESRHVMALPRGENAWLVRLDRFLQARKKSVGGMLRQEAAR